jgi:tyrosinase
MKTPPNPSSSKSSASKLRVRRSIVELQHEYEQGNKKPLEDLMRAWKGIKELAYDDPKSFFTLGGYHGEPFRGAGYGNGTFWGGYCNHGNVLFPTWHRIYCLKIEEALQSITGCASVMLPYWDETAKYPNESAGEPQYQGVPWAFTRPTFELDGVTIPNPLKSFKLPLAIADNISDNDSLGTGGGVYGKYLGYETVRYPLSGLVGTPEAQADSEKHNAQFTEEQATSLLSQNVLAWIDNTVVIPGGKITYDIGVAGQFAKCLDAPNYTVFSNTTSAQQWNDIHEASQHVVPLEEPHNHLHLAMGGFDLPLAYKQPDFSPIDGANGDMGENDTAALDPIFYFHHCNIDRVFWLWQKKHADQGYLDKLDLIDAYPGTNSTDSQGSTPGVPSNAWLTLESPLSPFTKQEQGQARPYTSLDCVNIEKQLGYTYSKGSLEEGSPLLKAAATVPTSTKALRVTRINKAPIKGSFIVAAYRHGAGGEKQLIGLKAVLNRWDSGFCANCQTHLEVKASFPIPLPTASKSASVSATAETDAAENYSVEIVGRAHNQVQMAKLAVAKPYRVELR